MMKTMIKIYVKLAPAAGGNTFYLLNFMHYILIGTSSHQCFVHHHQRQHHHHHHHHRQHLHYHHHHNHQHRRQRASSSGPRAAAALRPLPEALDGVLREVKGAVAAGQSNLERGGGYDDGGDDDDDDDDGGGYDGNDDGGGDDYDDEKMLPAVFS